jgi:hypothetical protein
MGLGLNKHRGWFLIFLRVPISELAYEVSCLFLSVPANHEPSILTNDKSGLAYCWLGCSDFDIFSHFEV